LHWHAPAGHFVQAFAAPPPQEPQQLLTAAPFVHFAADRPHFPEEPHLPPEQQPAANTVTANIPANNALFIIVSCLLITRHSTARYINYSAGSRNHYSQNRKNLPDPT
jgi:hypothetical protein